MLRFLVQRLAWLTVAAPCSIAPQPALFEVDCAPRHKPLDFSVLPKPGISCYNKSTSSAAKGYLRFID